MSKRIVAHINAEFPEVVELERWQTVEMTFMLAQGHWYWCHLIGLQSSTDIMSLLHHLLDILSYFPKLKRSRDPEHTFFGVNLW